jgi:hypothetical protein
MTKLAFITTQDAAGRLNLTHANLLQILSRYPHLRPDGKVNQDFVWTEDEIAAIKAHRAWPRSRRKQKGG